MTRRTTTKTSTTDGRPRKPGDSRRAPGMTAITITIPEDVKKSLEDISGLEKLSMSNWLDAHVWPEIRRRAKETGFRS